MSRIKSTLKEYFFSLNFITRDLLTVYKNFFHWNLSKIVILGYTVLAGVILSLPFLALGIYLSYRVFSGVSAESLDSFMNSGVISEQVFMMIGESIPSILGIILLAITVFSILTVALTYGYVLLTRVYESYTKWEKLPIQKNLYFSRVHITKFVGVLAWSSLYLIPPFLLAGLILLGLFGLTQSGIIDPKASTTQAQILGGLALIGFIVSLVYLVVLGLRLAFSYVLLALEDTPTSTARSYVRESLSFTRGRVIFLVSLLVPFVLITAVVTGVFQSMESARLKWVLIEHINTVATSDPEKFGDDHTYIRQNYVRSSLLSEDDLRAVIEIQNEFNPKKDGVDPEYLSVVFPYLSLSEFIEERGMYWESLAFGVVLFLLLESILGMVYVSILHILGTKPLIASQTLPSPEKILQKDSVTRVKKAPIKKTPLAKKTIPTPKKEVKKTRTHTINPKK